MVQPQPQRYATVAKILQEEIESGRIPVGSSLPSEAELQVKFEVSRCTVREALRLLRQQGYIVSQQGSGSRVITNTPAQQYLQTVEDIHEVIKFNLKAKSTILEQTHEKLPKDLQKKINLCNNDMWLKVVLVRCLDECKTPVMLTTFYLTEKFADFDGIKENIREGNRVLQFLSDKYHLVPNELEQSIRAIVLDDLQAQQLQCSEERSALEAIRQYYDKCGQTFLISCDITPAYKYTYSMRMRITADRQEELTC